MAIRRKGFSLTEVMIVVAFLLILLLVGIWANRLQVAKGRDSRRKADLAQWARMLEDYINDFVCYPEGMICGPTFGKSFGGYLSEIACDPINNIHYNYMYTYEEGPGCNKWFKIYAKLENERDLAIAELGCEGGCGPSNNYNYWVGSPNVTEVARLPDEWWPFIPGVPSPSPGNGVGTGGPGPTNGVGGPSPSPSPSPSPLPSPEGPVTDPVNCYDDGEPVCIFDCKPGMPAFPECCGSCCLGNDYRCDQDFNKCVLSPDC